jgi:hypothetical protein
MEWSSYSPALNLRFCLPRTSGISDKFLTTTTDIVSGLSLYSNREIQREVKKGMA